MEAAKEMNKMTTMSQILEEKTQKKELRLRNKAPKGSTGAEVKLPQQFRVLGRVPTYVTPC